MSGRTFAVTFNGNVTTQIDLFEFIAADDKPLELVSLNISQTSDAGDAQDEMLGLDILRGHATSGSGGSAATPVPLDSADSAAGFAAEVGNTTIASAGTALALHSDAFNVRAGMTYMPPLDARPKARQGDNTLVVRMSAPADSVSVKATAIVREL